MNIGTYEGLVRFDGMRFSTIKRRSDNDLKFASVRVVFEDSRGSKNTTEGFVLKTGTKRVEIRFTGINFDAPERIKFAHKLTNFEDDMSVPGDART